MAETSDMRAGLKGNVEEALRLFASEAEWVGLNLAETEFVLEETLKCYGSTFDGAMIRELFKFYRRYLGMASVSRRQQLLTRMTDFISDGHQNRAIALLCFLSADTDGQITSGAALDLAMVMPPDKGDPLTGPKFVAFHGCGGVRAKLGQPGTDDEGDVAAGLLLLGDMRLLPLLEEIWERLTPGGRHRMIRRHSNLVSALAVEFLLRRLEADKAEEYHGELGAALHNLPAIAAKQRINAVLDIRRNFGLPPGKEPMELIGHESLAETYERMLPRLQALIARETEPKVLPGVLVKWAEAVGYDDDADSAEGFGCEAVNSAEAKIHLAQVQPTVVRSQDEKPKEGGTSPRYSGFMAFLSGFSLLEAMAGIVIVIWALVCAEWILGLSLCVFWVGLSLKFTLIAVGRPSARWFAVVNYAWLLAYLIYRIYRHNHIAPMSPAGFILVDVMTIWTGTMAMVYLGYLRFAASMQAAPRVKD